jgi:hypothetical protein
MPMPRLYTDANPNTIAYVLDGGGSGFQNLPPGYSSMEAEYLAIMYGLNEYYVKWNKELDARQALIDEEKSDATSDIVFFDGVSSMTDRTARPLPSPVLVCSDNEVVVKQLSRQYHIANEKLRKLAQQIWQMTQNVDVKFEWVSRKDNPAGKMLR